MGPTKNREQRERASIRTPKKVVKGSLLMRAKIRKRKTVVEDDGGGREELELIQAEDRPEAPEAAAGLQEGTQVKKKRKKKQRGLHEAEEPAAPSAVVLASQASYLRDPGRNDDTAAATKDRPLKGMKKWLAEYHAKRPGADVLQQQIDEFIQDYDARQAKVRADREEAAAADGWTLVVNKGGRKKTTDADSGITVGAVSTAAAVGKTVKKQKKADITLDFYRFQKREQHRNKILELQQKFENDKKRLARLKAARKFTPY